MQFTQLDILSAVLAIANLAVFALICSIPDEDN
jgi:hypothetical protein